MTNERRGENFQITTELDGYYAHPDHPGPYPALLVFMEAFGLTEHIKRACDRLATAGFAALAPDIYHGEVFGYDDLDGAMGAVRALSEVQTMEETEQAFEWLADRSDVDAGRLGVIGFCMGGRLAFLTHSEHAERCAAAVSFYGGGIAPAQDRFGRPPLLDKIPAMSGPIMLGYGAEDQSIQPAEHGRIAAALSEAKKRYALEVFPEAGHGFMCEDRPSYSPGRAEQAWERAIEFLYVGLKAPARNLKI
jgi:carboxymethylenebutenolidase